MDLVLIRHPEVAIDAGICYGRSDIALRASPAAGATTIADKLAALQVDVGTLHCSPLRRCATVAALLADRYGIAVRHDARLAELDFGRWEGQHWDAVPRHELDAWAADIEQARQHGGESVAMLADRTMHWLDDIMREHDDAAGGDIVVLTHAGVMRILTAQALALPLSSCINWSLAMTGVCRLSRLDDGASGKRWTLRSWNG